MAEHTIISTLPPALAPQPPSPKLSLESNVPVAEAVSDVPTIASEPSLPVLIHPSDAPNTGSVSQLKASVPKYLQEIELCPEHQDFLKQFPVEDSMLEKYCYQYKGFWLDKKHVVGMLRSHEHFQARETDVLVCSFPKTGTTWLKALAFAVMKRTRCPEPSEHPLLSSNPHDLVPYLEFSFMESNTCPRLERFGEPRLLASHMPSVCLPQSVLDSSCKIVYVWRDPKDAFVSMWHFLNKIKSEDRSAISVDEGVSKFVKGVHSFGPFWDHVLGYWKIQQENPERVLFLKYETMKDNPREVVLKLSKFLECPFSPEEEANNVVDDIVKLCSFESLSNLEVNKNGKLSGGGMANDSFFRRGTVGDSVNLLSPKNAKLIDEVTESKFCSSDLIL